MFATSLFSASTIEYPLHIFTPTNTITSVEGSWKFYIHRIQKRFIQTSIPVPTAGPPKSVATEYEESELVCSRREWFGTKSNDAGKTTALVNDKMNVLFCYCNEWLWVHRWDLCHRIVSGNLKEPSWYEGGKNASARSLKIPLPRRPFLTKKKTAEMVRFEVQAIRGESEKARGY